MTGEDRGDQLPPEIIERAEAFRRGAPGISRRTIWIALGIAAVLGIGGAFADHSFDVQPTASPSTPVHHTGAVRVSMSQFVGLKDLGDGAAPPISLTESSGADFSLASLRGRPVVLTFLGAPCAQICPVVAGELADASRLLGAAHLDPAIVIVDANPENLSLGDARAAMASAPLLGLHDAVFLTGTLAEMQAVWKAYGVTIEVAPAAHALVYTDVIYLIDSSGHLRDALTPFANESSSGLMSLPASSATRFASGIATYVERLNP